MEQIRKESLAAELFAILYIQKKKVQQTFILVFLCFLGYVVFAPDRYLAEGSFLVKAKNIERSLNALEASDYVRLTVSEEDVNTEAEALSSKGVLFQTAEKLIKEKYIKVKTLSSDSGLFNFWTKTKTEQDIIENLAKEISAALTITVVPKTKIIHPTILWKDPKEAAIILKTLMWTYLEHRQGIQNSEEDKDFLQQKVERYLSEWKNKKLALAKLVEKYNAPDPNLEITNNLLLKKDFLASINELERTRDSVKSESETLEKMLTDGQNHLYSFLSKENGVLTVLVDSLQTSQKEKEEAEKTFLSKRSEVKDANEAFQNSYKTIRTEAVALLQHDRATLKSTNETIAAFTDKVKKLEQRNIELKKISAQMEKLQMEAALMASSFDIFYKRRDEAQLKGYLQANVAIMSHAKADPIAAKPLRIRIILLGLFLAVTLSLAVAFILDMIDQTIKTPRDVENYLHSPVIFSIEDTNENYK